MIKDAMYIRIMEKDNGFRGQMKLFIMMNSWLCYGGAWRCENKITLSLRLHRDPASPS